MTDDHLTPTQKDLLTDGLVHSIALHLLAFDGQPGVCSSSQLAEAFQVEDGPTHPVIRAAIAEVLRRGLAPVCATNRGYFIARTEDQARTYFEELESRAKAIEARAHNVMRAWHIRTGNTALVANPEKPMWVPDPEEIP